MKRSPWRYLWKSEDIRKKLLITLILLVIYRLAANIPVPGINRAVLEALATGGGAAGNLFSLPLHHRPDYYPAAGSDYPCARTQAER